MLLSSKSSGWPTIAAFASVCAGTQLLWLAFAPVDTGTAHYYGVSVSAVGWLAEIFPLLYVVLAIPAGRLLDTHFRPALLAGAGLMAAGGLIRLGGPTFAWAMAGQLAVAVAQPIVVSAMGKVSADYLPVDQRATGIAVASAGSFVGMLLALVLGPTLGAQGQIERLLIVQAALGVAAAVALALTLRQPGDPVVESPSLEAGAVKALWALPSMRTLCGLAFVGFGVFVALATWLQTLLHPAGISEQSAGALLVAMVLAGIAGCALLPPLIARHDAERIFMRSAVLVSACGCATLGVFTMPGARAAVIAVMGLIMLPALPVILTATERLAGSTEGTAGAMVWLAGNLGGLVVALVVQALVHAPLAAFLAMTAISLLGVPLARRFPTGASAEGATLRPSKQPSEPAAASPPGR
jgi:predicted MFS family arabinose efflux permease